MNEFSLRLIQKYRIRIDIRLFKFGFKNMHVHSIQDFTSKLKMRIVKAIWQDTIKNERKIIAAYRNRYFHILHFFFLFFPEAFNNSNFCLNLKFNPFFSWMVHKADSCWSRFLVTSNF